MKSETNPMEINQPKPVAEDHHVYDINSLIGHTIINGIIHKVYPNNPYEDHSWLNDHDDAC